MRRILGFLSLGVLLVLAVAPSASADTIYTYTGNPFTTVIPFFTCPPRCNVTISFALAQPLAANQTFASITPLTYVFSDGNDVFDPTNSTASFVGFTTGPTGIPLLWNMSAGASPSTYLVIQSFNNGTVGGIADRTQALFVYPGPVAAFNLQSPGSWAVSSTTPPVPEPTTILQLGTGLLGLGTMLLRRKKIT